MKARSGINHNSTSMPSVCYMVRDSLFAEGDLVILRFFIAGDSPEALPDHDQIILIYCRSGNRSEQAAEKLAAMGYTNIYEFGGINTWTGRIVTEDDQDENDS